ncbi:hypothetical protein [Moorena sp. SIO3F7]|nr:hypothetical protein [Moorena sp. SIO3F7]NEQ03331.1 transposase [Moorena sp. SIO3F7]
MQSLMGETPKTALHRLLPPQKPHTGKPNFDHRTVINGILWVH